MSTTYYYYIGLFLVVALIALVISFVMARKRVEKYLQEHPDASKVSMKNLNLLLYVKTTTVHSVDNAKPVTIPTSLLTQAFYLSPGKHVLKASFMKERPSLIYRKVTTSYDPQDIEVEVEPNKEYRLYFKTSEERYIFEEVVK